MREFSCNSLTLRSRPGAVLSARLHQISRSDAAVLAAQGVRSAAADVCSDCWPRRPKRSARAGMYPGWGAET